MADLKCDQCDGGLPPDDTILIITGLVPGEEFTGGITISPTQLSRFCSWNCVGAFGDHQEHGVHQHVYPAQWDYVVPEGQKVCMVPGCGHTIYD